MLAFSHSAPAAFRVTPSRRLSPFIGYPVDHDSKRFRGSITQPANLFRPASDSPYRGYPRTLLPACRLHFSRVGLVLAHSPTGQHYRISLPIQFPTIRVLLGTRSGFCGFGAKVKKACAYYRPTQPLEAQGFLSFFEVGIIK